MSGLKLFVCTDHGGQTGFGGVASVVLAHTEFEARELLEAKLKEHDLPETPFTLRQINNTTPKAFVLQDGDY